MDLEREVIDGLETAEGLRGVAEIENDFGHRSHLQVLMALVEIEEALACTAPARVGLPRGPHGATARSGSRPSGLKITITMMTTPNISIR